MATKIIVHGRSIVLWALYAANIRVSHKTEEKGIYLNGEKEKVTTAHVVEDGDFIVVGDLSDKEIETIEVNL